MFMFIFLFVRTIIMGINMIPILSVSMYRSMQSQMPIQMKGKIMQVGALPK